MNTVLDIKGLKVDFLFKGSKISSPIRGIDLSINSGETQGIVGETGCGKSLTALAIMGMLPANSVRSGSISLGSIGELNSSNIQKARGESISMIFQNPHSAFNPVFTIEHQLLYVARAKGFSNDEARTLFPERLKQVGLLEISRVLKSYPHELSGHAAALHDRYGTSLKAKITYCRRTNYRSRRHNWWASFDAA